MSYHNIKFQSLIRKYKSGLQEAIDKKKVIKDSTHEISIDCVYNPKLLLTSKTKNNHLYSLESNLENNLKNNLENNEVFLLENENNALFLEVSNLGEMNQEVYASKNTIRNNTNNMEEYLKEGILYNMFNVEFCGKDWIIGMYFINKLINNFLKVNRIHFKVNFFGDNSIEYVSAFHHFLYNSRMVQNKEIVWDWLSISNNSDNNSLHEFETVYKNNMLPIFGKDIFISDNINFIISTKKQGYVSLINFEEDMVKLSNSKYCFILTDDTQISTDNWNSILQDELTEFKVYFPLIEWENDPINPQFCFPIFPKKLLDIWGYLSPHSLVDHWLHELAKRISNPDMPWGESFLSFQPYKGTWS